MTAQYIKLGHRAWNILIYYNADINNFVEIENSLRSLDCPDKDIEEVYRVLHRKNTGFTFSNTDYKMSIVCIGRATNVSQFVDTAVHEAKHVQSHVCEYYGISEDSEKAAYTIGYIVRQMYKMVSKIIRQYV